MVALVPRNSSQEQISAKKRNTNEELQQTSISEVHYKLVSQGTFLLTTVAKFSTFGDPISSEKKNQIK
jgi:hypothetical protein